MFPIASAHELTCYCSLRSQQHASRHNSRFFCELCSQKHLAKHCFLNNYEKVQRDKWRNYL